MLTRIIGDIHGKFPDYVNFSLVQGVRHNNDIVPVRSIQIGDFGIGFANDYWHESVNDWMKTNPGHRFIRGNHDDPAMVKAMHNYIADGTVENDVMYIGGAWSIDHAWRTPFKDWWPDEELSVMEFDRIAKIYEDTKPRVMITHDCPTSIAWEMFLSKGLGLSSAPQIKTRTGEYLQHMLDMHQPELWFFGHWHHTRDLTLNSTKFQCLGELDYVDVDI